MKRKWYVTPGLVDQGEENERVHTELGKSIAEAQPDVVVLMENSARPIIEKSMIVNNFKGELKVETDPLQFYTNIEHVIASGDLVLLQNDWTDNYN
jgi:UDP-N-acetylmuramyl pentapeptide synthase